MRTARTRLHRRGGPLALLLLSVTTLLVAAPSPAGAQLVCPVSAADAAADAQEQQFLTLINNYRVANGRGALALDPDVNRASTWMSSNQADNNYLGHTDTNSRFIDARMTWCGVSFSWWGENVYAGNETAQAAFDWWNNSPPHNTNMLNANFTLIGIARAFNAASMYGWYWTTNFSSQGPVVPAPPGRYNPLTPARILDTRDGTGGFPGALGSGATGAMQVTGQGGVPAGGVNAVALNVTVTQPNATGFLTLYPTGKPRPVAANLNFTPGKTVPNMVVVRVSPSGTVDIYNSAGSTHVIVDVAGWFSTSTAGNDGRFQPLTPARILDTRDGTGGSNVRLGPGASLELQVANRGGVPATGAQAVVINVAVTNTTATSFLTVHPSGSARPLAANLNWASGQTVANRVFARLGANGRVTLYNNAGLTDLIVDANGWFTDASVASATGTYVPLNPVRILDTRDGTGGISGVRAAGSTVAVQVTGRGGVPASGVSAVILNATVVSPSAGGFLTLFPAGTARPLASDLNYAAGEVRPNLVVVRVGTGGQVNLYTHASAHVVFDVAGWFS